MLRIYLKWNLLTSFSVLILILIPCSSVLYSYVPLPSPCPPPCEHGGGTKFEVLSVVNSMFLFLFLVPCSLFPCSSVLYSRIFQAFAIVYPIETEILQAARGFILLLLSPSKIAYRILDYKLYNLNTPSNGGQGIVNSFSPPQPSPCRSIFPDQAFPGGGR